MKDIKEFVEKNAIPLYFAITIAITWGGIWSAVGLDGILGTAEIPDARMPILYAATLLGPFIGGILMTALVDGRAGFRSLFARLRNWRLNPGWYAFALMTAPAMILIILGALSRFSSAYTPEILKSAEAGSLLMIGTFMGLAVGFFEELGWTGFAIPKLRQKYSLLSTGLISGLVWGLWHMPLFVASTASSGSIPPALYLMVLLFSFLPAYRVLMVWLNEKTGSLLLTILMHAPLSASQLLLIPAKLAGKQLVLYNLIFAIFLWLINIFLLQKEKRAPAEKTARISA